MRMHRWRDAQAVESSPTLASFYFSPSRIHSPLPVLYFPEDLPLLSLYLRLMQTLCPNEPLYSTA